MIDALSDMPPGTIGFRVTGHLTGDDDREVIEPALTSAVDAGEVRALFVFGPEYEHSMTPGEVRVFPSDKLDAAEQWVAG